MLTQSQAENAALTVGECVSHICKSKLNGAGKDAKIAPMHDPESIAVIGKMLCEALNSMQDEVKFYAMKLPTKAERKEFLGMVDKVVFEDTAPEDEFIKGTQKRVCPQCEIEEINPNHKFCMMCGLRLRELTRRPLRQQTPNI